MTRESKRYVLLLCAVGLVLAAFVREWFASSPVFVGLWGVEVCSMGCRGIRWDNLPGAQEDLYLAGYIAFALSFVAAVLLARVAFGADRLVPATRKVLLVTLIAMGYFVLRAFAFNAVPGVSPSFMLPIGLGSAIGAYVVVRK